MANVNFWDDRRFPEIKGKIQGHSHAATVAHPWFCEKSTASGVQTKTLALHQRAFPHAAPEESLEETYLILQRSDNLVSADLILHLPVDSTCYNLVSLCPENSHCSVRKCNCTSQHSIYLTPLCADSAGVLWASFSFRFVPIHVGLKGSAVSGLTPANGNKC